MATPATVAAALAGTEVAKQLVQRVCRSFYSTQASILVDQLIRKEAMGSEELAGRISMSTKDVTKIIQKLLEDQLVSVHRRQELKEGAPKAQHRSYYYVDYSHATDVIKWRMYQIKQTVDVRLRNELDSQGFVCPLCKKNFTHLDALTLLDEYRGFLACDVCDTEVINNENEEEVRGNRDRMQRLVEQTRTIVDLLKKMEEVVLPKFDVVKWLEVNGPQGTTVATTTLDDGQTTPAVRIHLAGEDDEAVEKAKREADAEAKREQNQLPSWIAQSTVPGQAPEALQPLPSTSTTATTSTTTLEMKPVLPPTTTTNGDEFGGSPEREASIDLDSYYATLEESSFAPVAVDPASVALPASTVQSPLFSPLPTPTPGTSAENDDGTDEGEFRSVGEFEREVLEGKGTNRNGKRSRDEVDGGWNDEDEENGKKARVGSGTPAAAAGEEEDDEDDFDDFEDAEGGGGDGDPNPMISIGDKEVPFLEVDEAMQNSMTPEEYTAYWEVFQRLG